MAGDEGRVCAKCKEFKSWDCYSNNKIGKNGRYSQCKPCKSAYNRVAERARKASQPKESYEKRREKLLKWSYGITSEKFDAMLAEQNYCCAICSAKENKVNKHFFVDHCHKNGRIRGLLCFHCNTLLGMAKDNTQILEAAILYLERANG
jgi:hypothetical protein